MHVCKIKKNWHLIRKRCKTDSDCQMKTLEINSMFNLGKRLMHLKSQLKMLKMQKKNTK